MTFELNLHLYMSELLQTNETDSRDLRMLLKSSPALSKARHPAIMPRPSSKCFILEMENIKLLCFSEKCLIINPEERATQNFIKGLKEQFKFTKPELSKTAEESTMKLLHQKSVQYQDFEQVILETALKNVVQKFRRHLQIIKPTLEILCFVNFDSFPRNLGSHGYTQVIIYR